jgi:hypothetical protein
LHLKVSVHRILIVGICNETKKLKAFEFDIDHSLLPQNNCWEDDVLFGVSSSKNITPEKLGSMIYHTCISFIIHNIGLVSTKLSLGDWFDPRNG